jgi:hypothetical protein
VDRECMLFVPSDSLQWSDNDWHERNNVTGSEFLSCCFEELYRHLLASGRKHVWIVKANYYILAAIKVQLFYVSRVLQYGSSCDRQANNNESVENFNHVFRLKLLYINYLFEWSDLNYYILIIYLNDLMLVLRGNWKQISRV